MYVRLAMPYEVEAIVEMARDNMKTRPDLDFDEARVRLTCYRYLAEANPTIYVVDENKLPIAFLLVTVARNRFAAGHYMTQDVLYVRPDKRGTRAAALLMEHMLREAERLQVTEIVGGNDNSFNSERTARFLEHFGFERVGFSMRRSYGRKERQ